MSTASNETTLSARTAKNAGLKSLPIFSALTDVQIRWLEHHASIHSIPAGETIIEEGAPGEDRLYVVLEGEAVLTRRGKPNGKDKSVDYEIETSSAGGMFGGMPLLDGQPISVTARAKTPLKIAIIDLQQRKGTLARNVRNTIIAALQRQVAGRLRQAFDEKADSLRNEMEMQVYRNAVGNLVVTALCLLSFYTLALNLIPKFESYLAVNFAASPLIIIFFALAFFPVILRSRFPLAFFGMRLDNWRSAATFAVLASLAFIVAGALLKWVFVKTLPQLNGLSVVSFADVRIGGASVMQSRWYWIAVSIYLVLTPLQEFVARCGLQAPLYAFMQGSELHRRTWSILVSNLVFSAAHAHISLQFAVAAFVPGIFWGWIFARTNSLLAASVSHLLVGGAGIFLFGIEELVAKLM